MNRRELITLLGGAAAKSVGRGRHRGSNQHAALLNVKTAR
jgi:hypothetical protein